MGKTGNLEDILQVIGNVTILGALSAHMVVVLGHPHPPWDFIHMSYNERVGAVLIGTGLTYALYNVLTPALHIRENRLATSGQYSVTRNPVYNGFRLLSTGLAMSHPSAESISACACVYLATEATARIEEKQLEKEFGKTYLKYKEQVPRWIPKSVSNSIDRLGIFLLKYSPFR